MVERSLSMREVPGSIPGFSTFKKLFLNSYFIIITDFLSAELSLILLRRLRVP